MKAFVLNFALVLGLMLVSFRFAEVQKTSIQIVNHSSWNLMEIRLATSDAVDWGDNVLPNKILKVGETLTVELNAGKFDVLFVNDKDEQCELYDVELIENNGVWEIKDLICAK